jgi:hypothetical protein
MIARLPQIISPYHLYLNPKLVVQHYEIWRLVTNFLYFRKMGMLCANHALPCLFLKLGRSSHMLLRLCRFIS